MTEKKLVLQPQNFRLDTTEWEGEIYPINFADGSKEFLPVLTHPEKFAFQYMHLPKKYQSLIGEQLVLHNSVLPDDIRIQSGLLTDFQYTQIFAEIAGEPDEEDDFMDSEQYSKLMKTFNIPLAGCWNPDRKEFCGVGMFACLWSGSVRGDYAWYRLFDSEKRGVFRHNYLLQSGLSVRLLQD